MYSEPSVTCVVTLLVSDNSAQAESSEDAWAELKVGFCCLLSCTTQPPFFCSFFQPYLEAQTEPIVYAIQSVLSGVRSQMPSPKLNENLTEIITIVSSIVAVCKDSLPPASAHQGNEILRELSEHANKLSLYQKLLRNHDRSWRDRALQLRTR